MGSGLRAPEEEEDWEQLLGGVPGKAGSSGWRAGLHSRAGAMEVSEHQHQALLCQGAKADVARREAGRWWLIWADW